MTQFEISCLLFGGFVLYVTILMLWLRASIITFINGKCDGISAVLNRLDSQEQKTIMDSLKKVNETLENKNQD